ncbi:hypothetical protein [Plantactinospora sp. BB1]|uniref:hypothetical protein n=1 Tax=Plantactinospora sp. BB1 TaxID=2071627 RepID=UPI00131F24A4|nr:hypothetical protein [Plantactinospora sp. BB1]
MEQLVTALARLDTDDLDAIIAEFYDRTERCLEVGQDAWAQVYAAIAVAAVDALQAK